MAFNFKKLLLGSLTGPLQGRLLPKGIGGKLGAGGPIGSLTRKAHAKAGFGGATKRPRRKPVQRRG